VCATGVARVNQRAAIMARGEAIPPPFARAALPASQSQMPEEIELIWEDGVAPEMSIDFDATFMSKMEGLQSPLVARWRKSRRCAIVAVQQRT